MGAPVVLDLVNHKSMVELQVGLAVKLTKIVLTDWNVELDESRPPEPFFQIKFSDGIDARNLTFSQNKEIIEDAVQIPWKGRKREFEVSSGPYIRTFTVQLFDSHGKPLGFPFDGLKRCVLWLLFDCCPLM